MMDVLKTLFDILLFADSTSMVVVIFFLLSRIPTELAHIDPSKNKRRKPFERYRLSCFHKQTAMILIATLIFFAFGIVFVMYGSVPKETDDPRMLVPIAVMFVGTMAGGFALGAYYIRVGKRYGVFNFMTSEKSNPALEERAIRPVIESEKRGLYGISIFTCFYFFLIVGFSLMDIMFMMTR